MDRFDRIFELNRILQAARQPLSRRDLEQRLECSGATVKRIIEDMRLYLNAPIEYNREYNGYHYAADQGEMYDLPGLWFNASELQALLTVQQLLAEVQPGLLDSHLNPLRERIAALLGSQRLSGGGIGERIRLLHAGARPPGPSFQVLADATATRRRVAMEYYSRAQDRSSTRTVSPQRLSYHRDSWYLEAWCHLRQQLRTFAVDTVRSARLLEEAALEIDKQRLDAYFASSFGIFSGPERQTAELLFCQERARWVAEERWHPDQRGEFQEDGRYRLSLPYSNPQELLMEILKYGPDVEVLAPACLRRQVAQRLRLALGFYDDVEASASRS